MARTEPQILDLPVLPLRDVVVFPQLSRDEIFQIVDLMVARLGKRLADKDMAIELTGDADVDFATMMYPHHAQAVEMAKLVDGKGARPEVVELASEIQGAQQPEMDAFTRLLAQWGKPAPSATMEHAMDGMMTPAQMEKLRTLRGPDFDREWLTMMIAHHKGAIMMAQEEIEIGQFPAAVEMARRERPDIVLLDMNLPVMDGWEATRTLKADETTKAIPVIALTAHAVTRSLSALSTAV